MNLSKIFAIFLGTFFLTSCGSGNKVYNASDLTNITDSASYLSGIMTGKQMKKDTVYKINIEVFIAAIREAYSKDSGYAIGEDQKQDVFQRFQKVMDKKLYSTGNAFIENIEATKKVQKLDGGVLLEVVKAGMGEKLTMDDSVSFHLMLATSTNPKVFDTRDGEQGGSGYPFPMTKVFDLGVSMLEGLPSAFANMRTGGDYIVYLPYDIAQPDKKIRGTKPGDVCILSISALTSKKSN